ncbi:MAG: hypothetical protein ACKOWF_02175, partial [Chloroflexota bacterium]
MAGLFANDTIVNVRTATDRAPGGQRRAVGASARWRAIDPGRDTGFAAGLVPRNHTDAALRIGRLRPPATLAPPARRRRLPPAMHV